MGEASSTCESHLPMWRAQQALLLVFCSERGRETRDETLLLSHNSRNEPNPTTVFIVKSKRQHILFEHQQHGSPTYLQDHLCEFVVKSSTSFRFVSARRQRKHTRRYIDGIKVTFLRRFLIHMPSPLHLKLTLFCFSRRTTKLHP